jgi:hypothetical protein
MSAPTPSASVSITGSVVPPVPDRYNARLDLTTSLAICQVPQRATARQEDRMTVPEDRCALSDIPAELRRLYGQTASYSVLWKAAVEGAFPAERVRHRWFVRRGDLPCVAQALGIPTASAA